MADVVLHAEKPRKRRGEQYRQAQLDEPEPQRSWLHRRPQSSAQRRGVRLYPKRDRTLDRMSARHHRPREVGAPKTLVQEVASDSPGVRVFVVHSDERMAYERGEREKAMEKVRAELEALMQRVAKGKLKTAEKIGAAATRVLSRHHGFRYFAWELQDGQFRYFEHPKRLEEEKALEGKYLIQTEEQNLSAVEAVQVYKELCEVERAFSELKDVIEMRPIYHQRPRRVQAHVFVASLTFLLDRALEKKLKSVP